MDLFKNILAAQPTTPLFNESRFELFCNEYTSLKTLNPQHKFFLDKDINHIEICCQDDRLFNHNIKIKLDFYNMNKHLYEVESHSFPEEKGKELFDDEKLLKRIHKKFVHYIEMLEIFFDRCSKIDDICWVIDPQNPTTKHNWRRIVIGKSF